MLIHKLIPKLMNLIFHKIQHLFQEILIVFQQKDYLKRIPSTKNNKEDNHHKLEEIDFIF